MRILCLLLTGLWSSLAIGYQYVEHPQFDSPSAFQISLMTQSMKNAGLFALDQRGVGRIPYLNLDQVYQSQNGETIFLKLGLQPSDQSLIGQFVSHKQGVLYHGVTLAGAPYALFFLKQTKDNAQKILKMAGLTRSTASLWSLLIPSAHAESPVFCLQHVNQMQELRRTQAAAERSSLPHVLRSCAVSTLRGLGEGAVDFVQSSWYVIKTLFTNPAQLWNDVVQKYEQLTDFISNFQTHMSSFFETMRSLDPEIAAEVACSAVSGILVKALLGGGIAKAGLLIADKVRQMGGLRNALSSISRIQRQNPSSDRMKDLTREVIQCAR